MLFQKKKNKNKKYLTKGRYKTIDRSLIKKIQKEIVENKV